MSFFTVEKIARLLPEIKAAVARDVMPILDFRYVEEDVRGAEHPDFDDVPWAPFAIGNTWGGYDRVAWFRARVSIPTEWRTERLVLRFLVGPRDGGGSTAETLLYVDGVALQAIDIWHDEAWLPPELTATGTLSIALRSWSGVLEVPERRRFRLARLERIDAPTEQFFFLADTLLKAVQELAVEDLRRATLLAALDESFGRIDFAKPASEAFYSSVAASLEWLRAEVARLGERDELKPTVVAIGHAHIDMAWLWRSTHSREKAARTFATVLHLMRQYPEYRFMHSSPQLYKFLKQDQPEIYARVKERIKAGDWEITGGAWIEPDTNLPNGESLVRQILFGKRFVRDEFGLEMRVLWLPDVFGYNAALPQILRKSGIDYFLTSKLSWNQFNRMPHDTFRWRGLDGSEVLAHFVTTPEEGSRTESQTYNGQLSPWDVAGIWKNYRDKDVNTELLLLFGWGDGGGGPTREMLESGRALRNLPGLPKVTFGKAEPFFERLAARVAGKDLAVWDGELYLEYHRGTYTSQAASKRANRKAEALYHEAEWMTALATTLTAATYPQTELNAGWELILHNQFHDILPGSSIRQVYEDSLADDARAREIGLQALFAAENAIVAEIASPANGLVVFNGLGWPRVGAVSLPWSDSLDGRTLQDESGFALPTQEMEEDGERRLLFMTPLIPSLGYRAFPLTDVSALTDVRAQTDGSEAANPLTITPQRIESPWHTLEFNEHGQITRLWDKARQRDVLTAPGNILQAFQDKPLKFDAWDIDIFYQEKMDVVSELIEAVVEEIGPVRGVLRLTWRFRDSTITQRLTIYAHKPRIDFITEVDWQEHQVLLKTAFPVNVRATRATYDIQFGSVERPTHWNTSWDWARFEVPAQKWADLSEGDYGVALLNDCKYGYDVRDNVMRLTLIKSAIRPDALADKGRHVFTYSLLPHAGDWRVGDVAAEAHDLNLPLRATHRHANPAGPLPKSFSFVSCDAPNVVIETLKKSEDDDAWIVRIYENRQSRGPVKLIFGRPLRHAVECNLVEEGEAPVALSDDTLTTAVTPFEVKTFKVWL